MSVHNELQSQTTTTDTNTTSATTWTVTGHGSFAPGGSGGNSYHRDSFTIKRGAPADSRYVYWDLAAKLHKYEAARHTQFSPSANYSDVFNSWIGSTDYTTLKENKIHYSLDGGRTHQWKLERSLAFAIKGKASGGPMITAKVIDSSLNRARNRLSYAIFKQVRDLTIQDPILKPECGALGKPNPTESIQGSVYQARPHVQMDERPVPTETSAGTANQESDQQHNTIITRDTTQEEGVDGDEDTTQALASTEAVSRFLPLTARWMPLANFSVTTSQSRGDQVILITIPEDLYTSAKCAPNIAPFEAYMYGAFNVDIKIVLNANKFQAGKLVVSYLNDTYGAHSLALSAQSLLTRPHVIMDLPSRNEGVLKIPWKFHCPFLRIVKSSETNPTVHAGESAQLAVVVLSPLVVATGASTVAYGQVFYSVSRADFSGMSYRVAFQGPGDDIDTFVQDLLPKQTMKTLARTLEVMTQQDGPSGNQDKPNNPMATTVVPKPRSMFPNMKGIDDATCLRVDPNGMTNFAHIRTFSMDPKSPKQLARIWGLRTTSTWNASDTQGTRLITIEIDPSSRGTSYTGTPTPLEYAMSTFAFWRGTIELRLDFVSTSFHQGSVMISVEFGRPVVDTTDLCSTASTYTKTFHLGEQRSVTMVVPYIYDTAYRRTNGALLRPHVGSGAQATTLTQARDGLSLAEKVKSVVRVTVVNQLKPVQSVSSSIEMLVFWRAGPDFEMMGIKQSDTSDSVAVTNNNQIINLPLGFANSPSTGDIGAIRVQVDTGDKESPDETINLRQGRVIRGIQVSDDALDFKDILRRPTLIIDSFTADQAGVPGDTYTIGTYIPVMPPSRSLVPLQTGNTSVFFNIGGIGASPTTHFVNLFRFWRGSSKFTIHAVPGTGCSRIMITYIPHSGATLVANHVMDAKYGGANVGINLPYKSGFATEIMIPAINPTASVIVPYETENNWTLAWELNPSANYTWRDKGNLNAGHLVIQPIGGPATITVWWAAGDDFEMACYWGIPDVYNYSSTFRAYEDNTFVGVASATTTTTTTTTTVPTVQGSDRVTRDVAPTELSAGTSTEQRTRVTESVRDNEGAHRTRHGHNPLYERYLYDCKYVSRMKMKPSEWPEYIRNDIATYTQALVGMSAQERECKIADRVKLYFPTVQMDNEGFSLSDAATRVARVVSSVTPKLARNIAIGAIPVVGPGLAAATIGTDVADRVEKVGDSMIEAAQKSVSTMERVSILTDKVGDSMDVIVDLLKSTSEKIAQTMSGVVNAASMLFDMLLDLFIAWYEKSWVAVGVGIVRVLAKSFVTIDLVQVARYGKDLGDAISAWVRSVTTPGVQAAVDETSKVIVGVLAGLVGTLVGVYVDSNGFISFWTRLVRRMTVPVGPLYFNTVLNFVKSIFQVCKEMVMWALGKVSPEAEALKVLSGTSAEMQQFIADAQDATCEANHAQLSIPAYRAKVWGTVMQAMQIQRVMSMVPNNLVSPVISKLCADVVKMGNEKFLDMASCPVRYEPYVICVEGDTAIGKSFMTNSIVQSLLQYIDYQAPSSGAVYYRQPGSPFWSGYRDQPVVVFDEWMQSNYPEAVNTQITELYQLKTPNIFIPNMAHLEEKRIRANPMIVVLLTNQAFPHVDTVNTPRSVYRRRDVIVRAALKHEYVGVKVRTIPREVLDAFGHLQFNFYDKTDDATSLSDEPMEYGELLETLQEEFKDYHEQETLNVKKRMDQLYASNQQVPLSLIDIRDPFRIFYSIQSGGPATPLRADDVWVASQRLAQDAREVYDIIIAREGELRQPPVADPRVAVHELDENINVQWGASELFTFFVQNTIGLLAYALWFASQSSLKLADKVDILRRPTPIRGSCCVCLNECDIHFLCGNQMELVRRNAPIAHATCEACWTRAIRASGQVRCPGCRSEERTPVVSVDEARWYNAVYAGLSSGLITAADLFRELSTVAFMTSDVSRVFSIFTAITITMTCGTASLPVMAPYYILQATFYTADYYMRGSSIMETFSGPFQPFTDQAPAMRVVAQADDPPPGTSSSTEDQPLGEDDGSDSNTRNRMNSRRLRKMTERQERVAIAAEMRAMTYPDTTDVADPMAVVVHDLDSRGVRRVTVQNVCVHSLLDNAKHTARYADGLWCFTDGNIITNAHDGLCNEICFWAGDIGRMRQSQFYRFYVSQYAHDIRRAIHSFRTTSPGPLRETYRRRVPAAVQPQWMYDEIRLDQQTLDATGTTWWQWLGDIFERYKSILSVMTGLVSACAALVAGYAGYQYFFNAGDVVQGFTVASNLAPHITIESQGGSGYPTEGSPRQQQRVNQRRIRREGRDQSALQNRVQADLNVVVENYITRNTVVAELRRSNGTKSIVSGLGICGHKVLIPRHYSQVMRNLEGEIYIGPAMVPYRRQKYTYDQRDFTECANNDLAVWTWPASTDAFKDIRKFFVTEEDLLSRPLPADATLYLPPSRYSQYIHAIEVRLESAQASVVVLDTDGTEMCVRDVICYDFSRMGACGAALVIDRNQRPIIGMHVAGIGEERNGRGYSVIVTQETLSHFSPDSPDLPNVQVESEDNISLYMKDDVQVNYIGKLPDSRVPYIPTKSKLIRSSIYGEEGLKVPIEPAILSKSDKRYIHEDTPLIAGASAHGKLTEDFSTTQLSGPTQFMRTMLLALRPLHLNPSKLTPSEAICGFKDEEYYRPMDLKTSAGYPLMLKGKQKEGYIDITRDDGDYPVQAVLDFEAQTILDNASMTRKRGERYETLWVDTLKDEKRKVDKVMKYGGTRIICNGPMEHAIAMRQHFLHFSAAFMSHRDKNYHAVGINPVSREWDLLAKRLLHKSSNISTLDYSNFGPGLNARVCKIVTSLISEWTERNVSGVDATEMSMLMEEIVNSYHIMGSTVYSQNSGAPSGNALTSVINSMVNIFYILVAWQEILGDACTTAGLLVFEEFKRCVCLVVYGDDLIMSVRPEYEGRFNTRTLAEFFSKYKIVATDAQKSKEVVPFVKITEAEFLKRKFVYHESRNLWMSQLRMETILATTQWVWESANRDEATRVNCEVALMNAHGHGRIVFDKIAENINRALIRRRIEPIISKWDEYDQMIYDKGYVVTLW